MSFVLNWISSVRENLSDGSFRTANEETIKRANYVDDGIEDIDQRKHRKALDIDPVENDIQKVRDLRIRAVASERQLMFLNPWKALYLEKHGKLVRIGMHQHMATDRETYFTRQRAARQAQEESGDSI